MRTTADRRMFAKTIVLSDAFLDMPLSARCLYFTLGMLADDDGFVNSPKSVIRQCGASEDDLRVLLGKKFVLAFETGVIVIKHWRVNNYLRSDRYKATVYAEEKNSLTVDETGIYHGGIPNIGIPNMGKPRLGKDSIGKDSIGKDSIGKGRKGGVGENPTTTPKKTNVDLFHECGGELLEASLYQSMIRWMTYKDEQKKKYTPTGIKTLLTRLDKHVQQYGTAAVIDLIEMSISNNYQGIIWDRLKNNQGRQGGSSASFDWRDYARACEEEERNAEVRGGETSGTA